ncbi:MAG: dUTP diphosphatase [Janthinobacterium lividum]
MMLENPVTDFANFNCEDKTSKELYIFMAAVVDRYGQFKDDYMYISSSEEESKVIEKVLLKLNTIMDLQFHNHIYIKQDNAFDLLSRIITTTENEYIRFYSLEKVSSFLYPRVLRNQECTYSLAPGAKALSKARPSDAGIDIYIIGKIGNLEPLDDDNICIYSTGLQVVPPFGWHMELVGRSSLAKYGYALTNGIGLIDSNYRGEIKVVLTKISPKAIDLVYPFKACQLVMRRNLNVDFSRRNIDIGETVRGDGGFGSTDDN